MKKYTIHLLILTAASILLGFTGLEFPGASFIRFLALVSGIGLIVSCLDAVILSRKNRRAKRQENNITE